MEKQIDHKNNPHHHIEYYHKPTGKTKNCYPASYYQAIMMLKMFLSIPNIYSNVKCVNFKPDFRMWLFSELDENGVVQRSLEIPFKQMDENQAKLYAQENNYSLYKEHTIYHEQNYQ